MTLREVCSGLPCPAPSQVLLKKPGTAERVETVDTKFFVSRWFISNKTLEQLIQPENNDSESDWNRNTKPEQTFR